MPGAFLFPHGIENNEDNVDGAVAFYDRNVVWF